MRFAIIPHKSKNVKPFCKNFFKKFVQGEQFTVFDKKPPENDRVVG